MSSSSPSPEKVKKASDRSRRRERVREKSRERRKTKDRDREREKDSDREQEKDKDQERERDKDRRRNRTERRDRDRDRDRNRSRERSRNRSRERSRNRSRERSRNRSRDRSRNRSRDRSRNRSRERGRNRSRDRSRNKDKDGRRSSRKEDESKSPEESDNGPKTVTLAEIIASNPGISVVEAVQRLQAANLNIAMTGQSGVGNNSTISSGSSMPVNASMTGLVGVGGAATKFARELYVGNLPPGVTIPQLTEFLNAAMKQLGLGTGQGSVLSVWVSTDGHYAFAEFRTVEECNAALTYLNGLQIGAHQLRVGRTKSFAGGVPITPSPLPLPGLGGLGLGLSNMYAPPGVPPVAASSLGMSPLGLHMGALQGMGTGMLGYGAMGGNGVVVPATTATLMMPSPPPPESNVLMLTNLPLIISESQVKELLLPFGQIKAFNLIKDPTGQSRGTAVFEYIDPIVVEIALKGLNGLQLGDQKLALQRVPAHMSSLLLQPSPPPLPLLPPPLPPGPPPTAFALSALTNGATAAATSSSSVIRLGNMTTLSDLQDDELFEDLQEDVADECNHHGTVCAVRIPRPLPGDSQEDYQRRGVGFVFVQFTAVEGATKACAAIAGRNFNGRIVTADYYPESLFHSEDSRPKEKNKDKKDFDD